MREISFENGEFYHVYNRGTDKRDIFSDTNDVDRFFQSMVEFNTIEPVGGIYESTLQYRRSASVLDKNDKRLVNFICYCLNPNHYHFLLEQITDKGIEKLLHRLGTGYAKYFNIKNGRSGSLFQGKFKAIHIDSNEYILHLSSYINLNNKVHKLEGPALKSSLDEYKTGTRGGFCKKDIILDQFKSPKEYENFIEESLEFILSNREEDEHGDEGGITGLLLE